MKKINIAIDGFSGCGKSTLAKQLATRLNYLFVDTGAMYRAISFLVIHCRDCEDPIQNVINSKPKISFEPVSNEVIINGINHESEIRGQLVANRVSEIAADRRVREYLLDLQQSFILDKGVVMEGRDIATVVMPKAELKLFITADIMTRVERRFSQIIESGLAAERSEVQKNLESRDRSDIDRKTAPLQIANGAIIIDTTNMNREEQVRFIESLAKPLISPETYLGAFISK